MEFPRKDGNPLISDKPVGSPSRITDYFPASPKSNGIKEEKDGKFKKDPLVALASSVMLTPESSPAKESLGDQEDQDKSDTDSCEATHNKQVLLEEDVKSKSESKTKTSKEKAVKLTTTEQETKKASRKTQKKSSKKKPTTAEETLNNSLVTDYFPVRRSNRRCKSEIEKEKHQDIEDRILNNVEEGLKVVNMENKGRGVVASKVFFRGDFVVEYAGDLIDLTTAKEKESIYSNNPETGCYMYYFTHRNKNYCIDATSESGRIGRLINHSRTAGNCHTKLIDINKRPYLMLMASRNISIGEELLYDYGDRNKESLQSHPWLNL